jgi:hypothetical protein
VAETAETPVHARPIVRGRLAAQVHPEVWDRPFNRDVQPWVRIGFKNGTAIKGIAGNSGDSLAPHLHVQAMDGPDPLRARIIPFRLRRYERWARGFWEEVDFGSPAGGERIRVR